MHLVLFGLTISSSWGNGHATLWRGLLRALAEAGHTAIFYEKDVPYYADTRDGWVCPEGVQLRLYSDFSDIRREAIAAVRDADVAMVTSYCPDGPAATDVVLEAPRALRVFYDLDTPVTLRALDGGAHVSYLPSGGLAGFDLVLSYTGGRALEGLCTLLGATNVAPLYGWVDPSTHRPAPPIEEFRAHLSYMGTFAADRQAALEELFVTPARRLPQQRFVIGGAQYPDNFPWAENLFFVRHLPPSLHPAFFSSSRATLNVTRAAMVDYGYCPSGRIFEAAACGCPLLSDVWEGLDQFFTPGVELLTVRSAGDVLEALERSDEDLRAIGRAGQQRALAEHTAAARARELEHLLEDATAERHQPATLLA